jgi:hypothetical protein
MAGFNVRDALNKVTRALPTGASSVTSTAITLGNSTRGDFVAEVECLVTAPALAVGQLANASTMTYDIVHSVNSDLSSPATIAPGVIVQTGAGGVGAAAATFRWVPPTNVRGYIGLKATNSAAADASAASATLELLS